jgi:hypothetical protein
MMLLLLLLIIIIIVAVVLALVLVSLSCTEGGNSGKPGKRWAMMPLLNTYSTVGTAHRLCTRNSGGYR